jgi:hypothetical protein
MISRILRWELRGVWSTDLDPLQFRRAALALVRLGLAALAAGAALALAGLPPAPLIAAGGALLLLLPRIIIGVRSAAVREMVSAELPFFTALVQMAFAARAPLGLVVERMTRYRELPGVRALALAAWNNSRMLGLEPFDALKRAVEKLAPQKLVYRFNSLYTAMRIGEDVMAKLSLYMDMDLAEFSAGMQRRMDRLTSLISALVVGMAMLSVTAAVIGRGSPAMVVLVGGMLPAVLGIVLSLAINIPLMKMELRAVPLAAAAASCAAMVAAGLLWQSPYAPLLPAGVALAWWAATRGVSQRALERGFMDFVYTVFDELKRTPSVYRAVENAVTFGDYGPFNARAAAVLNALRVGDSRIEDVALRGLQPVSSVVLRMLFDIHRLGTLPRGTVDQLQNFVLKLFEYRSELEKALGVARLLALAGAAMVAFVNAAMLQLAAALSKISAGAQLAGVGTGALYASIGMMGAGYYVLFSKIGFSTRSGLLYLGLLFLAVLAAVTATGALLRV